MQRLTLSICLASSLAASPLMAADVNNADYRARWHSDIQTGYQALASQTRTLASQAGAYCDTPSAEGLEQTKQAWLDAFLAWQKVRFVDFGPVEQANRAWQFQFWPDPKNLVARKAAYLLKDEGAITAEKINESGVAVQGFPMVEYLLHDQAFGEGGRALPADRSCQLLVSVTNHIADNAEALTNDWSEFKSAYVDNDQYTDTTVRAAMTGLELLEERRLATPMGLRGNSKRNVYRADAWRSGASLAAANATVQGFQQQFFPAFSKLLTDNGQNDLAARIKEQVEDVRAKFPELNRPMAPLLADDSKFRMLQSLYVHVSQLTALVNDRAAVELGVVRGFNSSDGD
ncbi:MAG: imelysin family protein [Marinobacter sp.]|uniref:imelysin family protein n=1 Tax=Marinobacter sp. TaxID=50741 RepID=UPI003F9DDAD0